MTRANRGLPWGRVVAVAVAGGFLLLAGRYCVTHYVDFPVYWHASRSLMSGRRDLYSPTFVWGGTDRLMDYRYPPLFLLLFTPLGLLPYTAAGWVWFAMKVGAVALMVLSIHRMVAIELRNNMLFWLAPILIGIPYLLEEFHYGNVHFLIVSLAIFSLYLLEEERKWLSASILALSIAIKVFPIFFLPYFLIRKKFGFVVLTLLFVVVWSLIPAFYFGFAQNTSLLQAWYDHVIRNPEFHATHTVMDQSLKGVLLRYFTRIPYGEIWPGEYYPNTNVADISAGSLQRLWYIADGLCLLGIAVLCLRQPDRREGRLLAYGLVACAAVGFVPLTAYYYLVILIFPCAMISAYLMRHYGAKGTRLILGLTVAAVLLSFLPPLLPGSNTQHAVRVSSIYFFSVLTLLISLAIALTTMRSEDSEAS